MADLAQIKPPHAAPPFWRPTLVRTVVAVFLVTALQTVAADTGTAQWIRSHPLFSVAVFLAWLALAHVGWDRQRWRLLWRFRALLKDEQPPGRAMGS
jgi:hypothetical protein